MIEVKSPDELDAMSLANRMLAEIVEEVKQHIDIGVTTEELDSLCYRFIKKRGADPAFKGYKGYKHTICASVNEEVVHGIPSKRRLNDGDILSLDVGLKLNKMYADMAVTVPIGKISRKAQQLLQVTERALFCGINRMRDGNLLGDVSSAIQQYVERFGFSVVREYVGHGIGKQLHEEPQVPNYGMPSTGPVLKNGMVLALEPMVNIGGYEVELKEDLWTVITRDRSLSAHFEHTVAIIDGCPKILTLL